MNASSFLFIDDTEACLAGARKVGMKTIQFTDSSKLENELKSMDTE